MTKLPSWKDHYWYGVPVMRKRIETILEKVRPAGRTILEVGCNEGFVSRAMVEGGGTVTAVDYDPAMVAKAREQYGLNVVEGSIEAIPFEDDAFDVVVAGEVLEHLYNPLVGLKELFRVAKEQVVITLPVGEYWLGELTHQWELAGSFINHDSVQKYDALKDILVLSWERRRDGSFVDIPPFSTAELKKKYGIR